MLKIITKYTAYLLVFLLFSNAYAEENFCLDEDGFILPIFDQTNCETSAEIKENNGDCHIYVGDITDSEIVRKMFICFTIYFINIFKFYIY